MANFSFITKTKGISLFVLVSCFKVGWVGFLAEFHNILVAWGLPLLGLLSKCVLFVIHIFVHPLMCAFCYRKIIKVTGYSLLINYS